MKNLKIRIISSMMIALCASLAVFAQDTKSETEKETKKTETSINTAKSESGPTTPDSKVTVFVYRYKQYMGSALEPMFYGDDQEIAKMDNGKFFKIRLDAGKHVFQSNDKQSGIEIDLKPGEEYYIRVELVPGFWKGKGRLVLVPKEQGSFEIKKLKPLEKSKIKDHSKVVTDPA